MKSHHASFFAFLLFLSATASASSHRGYWNQRTDQGGSFDCAGHSSKEQLVDTLRTAGWNVDQGIPSVNWSTDDAVVVAPSNFYRDGNLSFFGLDVVGSEVVLTYGWKRIKASESVGANSATFGSTGEGYSATIVVAYNRALESGRSFSCKNIGLVD